MLRVVLRGAFHGKERGQAHDHAGGAFLEDTDTRHTQRPVRDGPVLVKHHVRQLMGIL